MVILAFCNIQSTKVNIRQLFNLYYMYLWKIQRSATQGPLWCLPHCLQTFMLTFSKGSVQTAEFPWHNATSPFKVCSGWSVVIVQISNRIKALVTCPHRSHRLDLFQHHLLSFFVSLHTSSFESLSPSSFHSGPYLYMRVNEVKGCFGTLAKGQSSPYWTFLSLQIVIAFCPPESTQTSCLFHFRHCRYQS